MIEVFGLMGLKDSDLLMLCSCLQGIYGDVSEFHGMSVPHDRYFGM